MPRILQLFLASVIFFPLFSFAAKSNPGVGSPFDMAIANEEKLISMLKANGSIPPDASITEAEVALQEILNQRQKDAMLLASEASETASLTNKKSHHKWFKLPSHKKHHHGGGHHGRYRPAPVQEEIYDGEVRSAKLLTILIEFPDFPHNAIQPEETDLYYEDYNLPHYEELLFQHGGYAGPNGENLITMVDYYEAQSGGSYTVTGSVAGWYKASQNAAYYGGNNVAGNDADPRSLVAEALFAAEADPLIDLADFDNEDRFDLDGDGDFWEPDGLIDHVQIIHSAVGEEAGGGALAENAIWSHRWNLGGILTFASVPTDVEYWGGVMGAYDYTIQPIDAGAGVIAHEYAHDLGLPDEYDTLYSGRGEPVSYWSIMASGNWVGVINGTEPTGFSPWAKEFLQDSLGGNWLSGTTVHIDDLDYRGETYLLDQASSRGKNNDVIRVDLPLKKNVIVEPVSGEYVYFSGSGNDLGNAMFINLDLTSASSAQLQFKAWLDIEQDWDYAYVLVNGVGIPGNITTETDPNLQNFGNGITGNSGGWVDAEFDLSAFAGEVVELAFYYWTDPFVANPGLYLDDISVSVDSETVLFDDAESESLFSLAGFTRDGGYVDASHYYLMEWRTHSGTDAGLQYIPVGSQRMATNEGLLIWYVDDYFADNWVGLHPGEGFLGVVDADQRTLYWSDGYVASTRYQIHDAAFSLRRSPYVNVSIDDPDLGELILQDYFIWPVDSFKDTREYFSHEIPDAGRTLTPYGLKAKVIADSWDGSVGKILLQKNPWFGSW